METAPTIVDPSSGCVYGTSACATGPTFTCVIEGACSDTIQTAGYVLPWVSQTSGSTLPAGFGFAETVPGTEQYNAGLQQYPGVGWSTNNPSPTFTFEAPWNLYGPSSPNGVIRATINFGNRFSIAARSKPRAACNAPQLESSSTSAPSSRRSNRS